ncbi:MAG: hypothetical protein AB7F88_17855 [Pyrinomonadaceae bacterium]
MKNSLNLVAAILIFVVMGCTCSGLDKFRGKGDPPPVPPAPSNRGPAAPANTTRAPGSTSTTGLSMDKYNQLKIDMPKSEVERILGGPGEEISQSSGGGMTFSVFKWSGEGYTSIIISFKNDKIMSKSQVGLK